MTTFGEHDGRSRVLVERYFPHPIEKVWRAVTDPAQLSQWFPSPVELELRPGGPMRFPGFEGAAANGVVVTVEEPALLVFTWGDDHFTFILTAQDGGTHFALAHVFDDRAGAASCATGWETCVAGLAAVVAEVQLPAPGPGFARHEALVREFGLDRPEVSEDKRGWTLRYERQLVCSAQVAWDAWVGTGPVTRTERRAPAVGEAIALGRAREVQLGTVTQLDEPRRLAIDLAPAAAGDHVVLELGPGTGHGARATLTVTGAEPGERGPAEDEWGPAGVLGGLADAGLAWATGDRSI